MFFHYIMTSCQHMARRSRCKRCKGREMCQHGTRRSRCIPCGGGEVCEHKCIRSRCVPCMGNEICKHKTRRSRCVLCKGNEVCPHKRNRYRCVDCGGSQICKHGTRRSRCVPCKGGETCEHNKLRCKCFDCGGNRVCKNTTAKCTTLGNPKYDMYCAFCFGNLFPNDSRVGQIRGRTKESVWVNALLQSKVISEFQWTWTDLYMYPSLEGVVTPSAASTCGPLSETLFSGSKLMRTNTRTVPRATRQSAITT